MGPALDENIILYLNSFAGKSPTIDTFLTTFLEQPSFKLLPLVFCLVWLWFSRTDVIGGRMAVGVSLVGGAAALLVSRVIQNLAPYRPRPMHSETLNFVLPAGVPSDILREWSSFPSDNTALAFALATGIWFGSKRLGWISFFWSAVVVGFARVYAGRHFPSDIVGGALVGIVSTCAVVGVSRIALVRFDWSRFEQRAPALFYSCLFVVLFQVTTMFDDARRTSRAIGKLLSTLF
jgi:membrane-associated phospholipid phosphatase